MAIVVNPTGEVKDLTIKHLSHLIIDGGKASNLIAGFLGRITVRNGYVNSIESVCGVVNVYATVDKLFAYNGGSTAIKKDAEISYLHVGSAKAATVHAAGRIEVAYVERGKLTVLRSGRVSHADVGNNNFGCAAILDVSGHAQDIEIRNGGVVVVNKGGAIEDVTVENGGILIVQVGGFANRIKIEVGGKLVMAGEGAVCTEVDTPDLGLIDHRKGGYLTVKVPCKKQTTASAPAPAPAPAPTTPAPATATPAPATA